MAQVKYSRYYTYIKPVIENKFIRSATPYIFSLMAVTIFILFAIRPTLSTIVQLQKNIETHQQIYNALLKKEQDLSTGKQNLENIAPEIRAKIDTSVPSLPEVPALISSLRSSTEQPASASAMQIQPVTIIDETQKPFTKPGLTEISFVYNIQGNYASIVSTLDLLSKASRLNNLGTININKLNDSSLVLSVSGKAFYLK